MSVIRIQQSFTTPKTNWIAVDDLGLPRYWLTIWSFYFTLDLADASIKKKLTYIDQFYQFAESIGKPGFLDDAIADIDLSKLGSVLEAYFIHLQNIQPINSSTRHRWEASFGFVKDCIFWLSKNTQRIEEFYRTEAKVRTLEQLYSQLRIGTRKTQETIRSIPCNLIEFLLDILDPGNTKNPFRNEAAKWRVYVIFNLLLYLGLRSGELLNLNASPIKTGYDTKQSRDIYWINVTVNPDHDSDTRYSRPGIKTVDSVRQIPIFEWIANLVEEYSINYRGKPDHSYLLNSQMNRPLSYEALKVVFWNISKLLPSSLVKDLELRTGKSSITAHDLRYTCVVARLNHLYSMDYCSEDAFAILRTFFGWSRTSEMPLRYAKAALIERESTVWNRVFDERVDFLRSIGAHSHATY